MPNVGNARRFTEADKANALVALASNSGNIKRTASELGILPATLRRWRGQAEHGSGPSTSLVVQAKSEFADRAETIRNKALESLDALINEGRLSGRELITAIGVLDDKVTRAKGMPTNITENRGTIPSGPELRELMSGFVEGAVRAAEKRELEIKAADIVDAEIVD